MMIDKIFSSTDIYLSKSDLHGTGLFANKFIPKDTIIERYKYLPIKAVDMQYLSKNIKSYFFIDKNFIKNNPEFDAAIVLGKVSFCNSTDDTNASCVYDVDLDLFILKATKDIEYQKEITLKYL